jgi:hypothetical protein
MTLQGAASWALLAAGVTLAVGQASFVAFESEVLPAWLDLFHVPGESRHN